MGKKIFCAAAVLCILLCGCADMTDIEKIKSIAAIGVSDDAITLCTVSVSAQEKTYEYEVYCFDTDSIFDAMNKLNQRTGKQASLAHLSAVFFEDGCSQKTIKNCVDSVVGDEESHPKAVAAFINCSPQDFFDGIKVPSDCSMYRLLTDVPDDKFAAVTRCEMIELYYAVNLDDCAILPMFEVNAEGSMIQQGAVCVGTDAAQVVDEEIADAVNLILHGSKPVYYSIGGGKAAVKTADKNIIFDKKNNTVHIYAYVKYNFGTDMNSEFAKGELEQTLKAQLEKTLELKNIGFDILSLKRKAAGAFVTDNGFQRYVNENGGRLFLRNMKYNVVVEASEGDL